MEFSIIIPTANRPDLLEICIQGLQKQIKDYSEKVELIISDDSLSERTNEKLRSDYSNFLWLTGPKKGPAANRNFAAKQSKGKWLLFIDDDCIPSPQWFASYQRAISKNEDAVVFEGKTIAMGERTRMNQVAPVNETGGNLWSCNFLIEKNFFMELTGFDESFPYPAMEDVDLCMRIKNKSKIIFVPDATVSHPWRTMKPFSMFSKHLKSHIVLAKKHGYYFRFSYRWSRLKIFLGQTIRDLLLLSKFSFKGVIAFWENVLLNFCLIFA